jgi:hypothetical protein
LTDHLDIWWSTSDSRRGFELPQLNVFQDVLRSLAVLKKKGLPHNSSGQ